jgi:hypothetical protein
MLRAYQMIMLISGSYKGENAQVLPPIPKDEKKGYLVQVTGSVETFRVKPGQYAPLRARKRKR